MKKPLRLIAALLAICVLAATFPPTGLAADSDLRDYVDNAVNGVADLNNATVFLNDTDGSGSADAPYIIDKPITIQNGTIVVRAGGFVLDADVKFSNVQFQFTTTAGNFIAANGHTLTLEDVSCVKLSGDQSFNLFGGTMTGTYEHFTIPAPGMASNIIINGSTSLQGAAGVGNIYAGNLFRSSDGTNGTPDFAGSVHISINSNVDTNAVGTIYASGAPKNAANAVADNSYTVSGGVTISSVKAPDIVGSGSTTGVIYRGDGNLAEATFTDISSLTVESGKLALMANSYFRNNGTLTIKSGAKLDLQQTDGVTLNVHDFNGEGGFVFLGKEQNWPISGQVTGNCKIAVGGTTYDDMGSTTLPTAGQTYITAPNSQDGNFELLPYGTSNTTLIRDTNGNWIATAGGTDKVIVESVCFRESSVTENSGVEEVTLPLVATYAENSASTSYLDFVPLYIDVNGKPSARTETDGYFSYTYSDTLSGAKLIMSISGDELTIRDEANTCIPDGTYRIDLKVTKDYNTSGTLLTASTILTVGSTPTLQSISINSTTHKTEYSVGDALDVTNLTIEAAYSDGNKQTVPVTADMVTGFNSSSATESQTLTVSYEDKTATYTVKITDRQQPAEHTHTWATAWKSDTTHHWHDCTASDCTEKGSYAAHTAGDWVVDQPATATQSGTRHRSCSVCGYEMDREPIPATGGDSSTGGGSSTGGDSSIGGGPSIGVSPPIGGGAPSGGSSGNTTTDKNPDGSTTSTTNNKTTGTVTETTKRPDGSKTVVETKKDGTVTTTDTAKDGSTVKTVARPDGTTETTVKQADGLTATVQEGKDSAKATVRIPAKVAEANPDGVALPIPPLSGANASVTVRTGTAKPIRVEIPVYGDDATTVACLVNSDGTETILKTVLLTEGQIAVSVPDGATVRIRDNGKDFQDVHDHWAKSAIDFVAARELFSGKTADAFAPDASMSRAMLATVLARLDGVDAAGGDAYRQGLSWAVAQGISDGRDPDGQVTREQFVTMLYRYAGSPAATDRELHFSDAEEVSPYAREAICWAAEKGILSGYEDGSAAPQGKTTRAQAAAMLVRYVEFLNIS